MTGVGGRFGDWCDRIDFKTSKGRILSGGGGGGKEFKCSFPRQHKQPYILAIDVGMGGHIHNVSAFYLDLSEKPELAIQVCHTLLQPKDEPVRRLTAEMATSELDAHFLCTICLEVVEEPQECSQCTKLFCLTCINQW